MSRETDAAMRAILTSENEWQELIATPDGADLAESWLTETRISVQSQIAARRPLAEAPLRDKRAYKEWRRRALGFLGLVDERRADLMALKRQRNVERLTAERNTYRDVILRLAQAIEAHQAEGIGDSDLHRLLDDVQIPNGIDRTVSLRLLLLSLRATGAVR